MRLFDYSPDSLLATVPTMLAFPNLNDAYAAWRKKLEESGCVEVRLGTEVVGVDERGKKGVVLRARKVEGTEGEDERKGEVQGGRRCCGRRA